MIQPEAASEAIQDASLSSLGFWPRFLVAWPKPNPPRVAQSFEPDKNGVIADFWKACDSMLNEGFGADCAHLPIIQANDDAYQFICKFFDKMEASAKRKGGELESIKPFALRATEQLFRIAGVLAVFSGANTINLEAAIGASKIVGYSLETWLGVIGKREESTIKRNAAMLFNWLSKQPEEKGTETAMSKIGPKPIRPRHHRDAALAYLEHKNVISRRGKFWFIGQ